MAFTDAQSRPQRQTGPRVAPLLAKLAATAITTGTLLARRMHDVDVVVVSAWHFAIGGTGLTDFEHIRVSTQHAARWQVSGSS